MKTYQYTAKNETGTPVRDVVEADSRQKALSILRKKGLTVVSLTESEPTAPGDSRSGGKHHRHHTKKAEAPSGETEKQPVAKGHRIRMSDMAIFCRQLAISVNSGLSLREALEGIHEDMDVPKLKAVLADIIQKLYDGIPFSKAVAAHPGTFSPVFIGMIVAAEEAGSLAETLNRLAGYLDSSVKLQRKIKSLMAYPAFVAAFFILICLVMVFAIVPRFEQIFADLGASLPPLTRTVFGINRFVLTHSPLLLLGLVALVALVLLYRRTAAGRMRLDRLKLRLPIAGTCLQRYVIARICRCMAIMLKSGVPISTTLRIVSVLGNNAVIESAIIAGQARIISGAPIAEGLAHSNIFPALLIRMLRVGENAGRLPEVLDRVADAYEDQVDASIVAGTALLEPIIISFFGLMVLLLVLSIYLPVFTVSMSIR